MATDPQTGWLRGNTGYKSQMTAKDTDGYFTRLKWIQAQKDLGKLPRGWQTRAARETGRSVGLISQVLNMVHISPPILDQLLEFAKEEVGQGLALDMFDDVSQKDSLVQALGAQLEAERQLQQDDAELEAADYEALDMKWMGRKAQREQRVATLEARYNRAVKDWEQAEIKRGNWEQEEAYGTGWIEPESGPDPVLHHGDTTPVVSERAREKLRQMLQAPVPPEIMAKFSKGKNSLA
jgi:hypothetical protein